MSILDDIVGDKRAEVARSRLATPAGTLAARCRALPPARDFAAALRPVAGSVALIAEVKRASPSRGVLGDALDPLGLATTYAEHGAAAISVLTDAKYFQGSLDLLEAIRAAVDVPLLRKDFIIDEYQLWESRAAGADAVLLIVAILESRSLRDLLDAAKGLGLAALVEAHTAGEVDVALATGARILGINNRDLRTFETRIETTLDLLPLVPPGPVVVSESGFFTGSQVRAVAAAGAHAVLVGEGLVTAADIPAKLRELTLRDAAPTGGRRRPGEGTPGEEGPTGGRRRPGEGTPGEEGSTGGRRRPGEGTPGEEGPTGGRRRPGEGAPTVDSNG